MPKRETAGSGPRSSKDNPRTASGRARPKAPPAPKLFDSFESAVAYLNDRVNVERMRPERVDPAILRLDRMEAILSALGDPHKGVKFVHVAGSKGKGSTCEMIVSSLAGCGYTTGLYTSPHLIDLRERIRIGNQQISHADFTQYAGRVAGAAEEVLKKCDPATFFELVTAMAFAYFADQAVDIAVIEVGLGGRWDSTNVITPEVTALTAIQLEHTQILGDTLEKIAREKAGIIKPGVPVVTVPQQCDSVINVFRQVAQANNAPLAVLGEDLDFSCRFGASRGVKARVHVCLTSPRSEFEHFEVPLPGAHQAYNCGLALAVLDSLRARGFRTPERQVQAGLARTPNHGRMEVVSSEPRIIIDGAHNAESVQALFKALSTQRDFPSVVTIFGCNADKNVPAMLSEVALGADKVIFTRAHGNPRAVEPRELHRRFVEINHHKMVQTAPTLREALEIAARAVTRDDLICVTGSFYLAGEAKKLMAERARRTAPQTVVEPKPPPGTRPGRRG